MSFRVRITLALAATAALPLLLLALGVRSELNERLTSQFQRRLVSLVQLVQDDLAAQGEAIAGRLEGLREAMVGDADNRLRRAVAGDATMRRYLLDYASEAKAVTGLDLLQIQDAEGRILSSGHFRNEFGRLDPRTPALLSAVSGGTVLLRARGPTGPFLALARVDSLSLGGTRLYLVGGMAVEPTLLARLLPSDEMSMSLRYPAGEISVGERTGSMGDPTVGPPTSTIEIPYVDPEGTGDAVVRVARLEVAHSLGPLRELRRGMDRRFIVVVAITLVAALLMAHLLASRISRPLSDLARKTAALDLERLDVDFESERPDEIGRLSRILGAMTDRLRNSLSRLRDAERRAAIGDLARQVNHDIRNGLAPIRHVFRHLSQAVSDEPAEVPRVFRERQGTLESSISYLETLAGNYARLSQPGEPASHDVNEIARNVVASAGAQARGRVSANLDARVGRVMSDGTALRRVLENLVANALDALPGPDGSVHVETAPLDGDTDGGVRISVTDTGRGMSAEERERALEDFFSTREGGTGLGLSIVRRLVRDMEGKIRIESAEGQGTTVTVELPTAGAGGAEEDGEA